MSIPQQSNNKYSFYCLQNNTRPTTLREREKKKGKEKNNANKAQDDTYTIWMFTCIITNHCVVHSFGVPLYLFQLQVVIAYNEITKLTAMSNSAEAFFQKDV